MMLNEWSKQDDVYVPQSENIWQFSSKSKLFFVTQNDGMLTDNLFE